MAESTTTRVLIVDDSRTMVELIKVHLLGLGYEFIQAVDAFAGLQLAEHNQPDLVITDVRMRALDGFALAKKIREHPKLKRTGILLMSSDTKFRNDALKLADGFITKPINTDELTREVKRILKKRKAEQTQVH